MKNRKLLLLSIFLLSFFLLGVSRSEDFPSKPIKLVSPYAAGGGTDMSLRLLSERLQQKWGQPVVVEYKPGAGGNIGSEYVFRSRGAVARDGARCDAGFSGAAG